MILKFCQNSAFALKEYEIKQSVIIFTSIGNILTIIAAPKTAPKPKVMDAQELQAEIPEEKQIQLKLETMTIAI